MIDYYLITKPGIVLGNLVTLAAGFLLASKGVFIAPLFLATLLGLALVMASACICNNIIDMPSDALMKRTKKRPLVTGIIPEKNAWVLATLLGVAGGAILWIFTNPLTVFVAAFGFFVYVVLYSMWKRHTIYGTAIGSIAGAVPPLVGYCAVSNDFDAGAWIFFAMMVLWQMPHFFAIAMYHYDDYKAAGIPVLPLVKGPLRAKIHMTLYIIAFLLASAMLTLYGYTDDTYLLITACVSTIWLGLCIAGFFTTNDKLWGRQMFRFSLVLITIVSLAIPLGVQ